MKYIANTSMKLVEQEGKGLIQMENGTLHILNTTAMEVYKSITDDSNEIEEIADKISKRFSDVNRDDVLCDVTSIVKDMVDKGILIHEE